MPSPVRGYSCPTCHGVRPHVVRILRTAEKTTRVRVCAHCAHVTPLSPADQPGIVCPKCGDVRLRLRFTRQRPGRIVRVKQCRGCGHRVRTRELLESCSA